MKTTIEIADDLFQRAQQIARKEKTTFRALAEQGLRLVLRQKQSHAKLRKWKPMTYVQNLHASIPLSSAVTSSGVRRSR